MRQRTWLIVVAAAGLVGCGPGNGLNLAPVRGTVSYKGELLKNGTIIFEPDESQGTTGPNAIGTINADGTFILSSESAADGAVVGSHKIMILGLEANPTSAEAMPSPEADPTKYLAAKTQAGLNAAKAATTPKKDDVRTVTGLDGRPFRVVVPEKVTSTKTSGITTKVVSGSNVFNIDIDANGEAKFK